MLKFKEKFFKKLIQGYSQLYSGRGSSQELEINQKKIHIAAVVDNKVQNNCKSYGNALAHHTVSNQSPVTTRVFYNSQVDVKRSKALLARGNLVNRCKNSTHSVVKIKYFCSKKLNVDGGKSNDVANIVDNTITHCCQDVNNDTQSVYVNKQSVQDFTKVNKQNAGHKAYMSKSVNNLSQIRGDKSVNE